MPPLADLPVDAALVRRLLEEQHPDLAGLPLRHAADGWDNLVLRLGDDLAVRVPRRRAAAGLIAHEQAVLPSLAGVLPIPIPAPIRIGRPSDVFPWPWSVVPWFDGRTVAAVGPPSEGIARDLAAFLRALHRPAPADAPANPVRGVPLAARGPAVEARLDALAEDPRLPALRRIWAAALAAPAWAGPAVWLHGDLHPANLIARDGRLVAVIDFGDVTAGDPATDLATAWLTFEGPARAAFRHGLDADGPTWRRASGWALTMAAAMVLDGTPTTAAIGERALDRLAEETGTRPPVEVRAQRASRPRASSG